MAEPSWRAEGFGGFVGVEEARARLLAAVEPVERTRRLPLADADGRVLAERVRAERSVPHYRRAAMDGYAVRAADTDGTDEAAPDVLRPADDGGLDPGTARPVQTGEALPDGADAVVRVERAESTHDGVRVLQPVAPGTDVAPVGEDVAAGRLLYEPGHRLRPADLGLLASVGHAEVVVVERPVVRVVPTGTELVHDDPDPGEVVETNGLTVARYVERWGGRPDYREPVEDDPAALRAALAGDGSADLVVTTGGSSVGEADLVPDVVEELGDLLVHGVAIKPGHPLALGVVEGTPILSLPGYPVSTIVGAVQFLRPALARAGRLPLHSLPSQAATLSESIAGEPGVRSYERVRVEERDGGRVAVPVEAAGAGVLSSVALADGWVEVPESGEEVSAGETVRVEIWSRPT